MAPAAVQEAEAGVCGHGLRGEPQFSQPQIPGGHVMEHTPVPGILPHLTHCTQAARWCVSDSDEHRSL